jgi:MFS family permease
MSRWLRPRTEPLDTAESTALIRNRDFTRLWGAQVLSQIAQNLLNFALIIRVFELAQGTRLANLSVALLILSFGVPSIFFAAAAGVYVDHWNRRTVMLVSNLLRAILVLGYLAFEHNLAIVLLLSFVISSITQFFAPAESASIPVLVGEKNLLRANSLFIFTLYASFIIGYSASAPVIAAFGDDGPYYITSIMFLLATLLVFLLPTIRAKIREHVHLRDVIRSTKGQVVRNWQLIRANHNLSFPIGQLTITQGTVGILLALAPALSLAVLDTPIQNASHVLIIPAGLGMVLGVLAVGQMVGRSNKLRVISLGLIVASATLMLVGLSGQLHRVFHGSQVATTGEIAFFVASLILILGFMNAAVSAAAQTLLQENTTDESRGKVFGALNMMINIAATLPILFAGILADLTSVTKVITALGALLLIFAIAQYRNLSRRGLLAKRYP